MIRKFTVVLAAATVLGLASPAASQWSIAAESWGTVAPGGAPLWDPGYGNGDWWNGPFIVGRWGGDVYMQPVVVVRRPVLRVRH